MNRKALILASAGVLSLGLVAATNAGVSSQGIARAENHSHGEASLTEIGFDWRDPLQDGYKPYWRCSTCCSSNPASSRFKYEDKTTAVTADDLKLTALATASAPTDENSIKNVSIPSDANIDQSNATYVTVDDKTAAYFSRSRALNSNGGYADTQFNDNPSSFGFSHSGTDAVTSVTFSYRYKSWNYAPKTATEGGITYSSLCQFTYGSEAKSYSLDKVIFNDDVWHTATINAKEVGVDSSASLTNFSFKFADLRGYFMISGLSYSTEKIDSSLATHDAVFGAVDTSDVDSAITDCSVGTVKVYKEEACTNEITSSDSLSTLKKAYVKIPLTFATITTNGRADQDYALGRLYVDIDFNSELLSGAAYSARLDGYTVDNWFKKNMLGNFIDSTETGVSEGMTGIDGKTDTAISKNGISAIVSLDFTNSSAYALEHTLNAFTISAKWSAYQSEMFDTFSYPSGIRPVAYITGGMTSWTVSPSELYQMVPNVNSTDSKTNVVWTYIYDNSKTTSTTEIKVLHNGGWNGCRYVQDAPSTDSYSTSGDIQKSDTNGKLYAYKYRITYITGEGSFYVHKA